MKVGKGECEGRSLLSRGARFPKKGGGGWPWAELRATLIVHDRERP